MHESVTPLVARGEDLGALEAALDDAQQGRGTVHLVAGDAGTGKTRLAQELGRTAQARGCTVLWGGCTELNFALPFLPFNEAIGAYLSMADVARLREQLGPLADAVATIIPQMARQAPQFSDLSDAAIRLQLFEGVVAVLRAVANETGSALVIVDDVHWADASTCELLDFVARRARQLPLLLVATYRSDEINPSHPLRLVLDGWRRAGLAPTTQLHPLGRDDVSRLVCARLGVERVSSGFVDLLVNRSEGVPFAVEELIEEAISSGHIVKRDGTWQRSALSRLDLPDTLAAGILQRLHRLQSDHQAVIAAAAVLGRTFHPHRLPDITDLTMPVVSAALDAATKAQIIESDPANRSRLRFHHAITHEAIRDAIPAWEASRLHSRAADALVAAVPEASVIDRARHLLAADRPADAAPLCAEAAQMTARAGAFAEAAMLYGHALASVDDPVERGLLLCERGRMLMASGAPAAAVVPLAEGVELLERTGHPSAPQFLIALGGTHWLLGNHRQARDAYERARPILENASPTADLALLYARLSMWHNANLDCEAGLEWADRAMGLADELNAEQARAIALIYRGGALCELGRRDEGIELMDRGTAEAMRLMLPEDLGTGLVISAEQRALAMRASELPPVVDVIRAVDMGPAAEVFASLIEALVGRFLGDVGQTEAAAQAVLDGAESAPNVLSFLGREFLAWARLEQGRLDEAEALMEDLAQREGMWHRTWGPSRVKLAVARGGPPEKAADEARTLLSRVPGLVRDPLVASTVVPVLLAAGAEAEADRCVAAALGPDRHPLAVGAAADLAAYRGDTRRAEEWYREAAARSAAAGYERFASTYHDRLGQAAGADAMPADVIETAPKKPPRSTAHTLSQRETELLGLLAQGKTDQQIAEALFISLRTVRSHLDRIRDKTGRRRRPELTHLAIELGLLDG